MIRITKEFRQTITECGLSYRKLQEKTGIDWNQFGRWKHGKRLPTIREINLLCIAFNCNVGDIIEFVEDKKC